jgi:hypothetical protein
MGFVAAASTLFSVVFTVHFLYGCVARPVVARSSDDRIAHHAANHARRAPMGHRLFGRASLTAASSVVAPSVVAPSAATAPQATRLQDRPQATRLQDRHEQRHGHTEHRRTPHGHRHNHGHNGGHHHHHGRRPHGHGSHGRGHGRGSGQSPSATTSMRAGRDAARGSESEEPRSDDDSFSGSI